MTTDVNVKNWWSMTPGLTVGEVGAAVLSYLKWKSVMLAIVHGGFGWFYIIYYAIRYGTNV
jgi:hypothetical protein